MALKISSNYWKIYFPKLSVIILLFAVFASGAASGYQFASLISLDKSLAGQAAPTNQDKTPQPIESADEVKPNIQTTTPAQENKPSAQARKPVRKTTKPPAPPAKPASSALPSSPSAPPQSDPPPASSPPAEELPPPGPPTPEDPPTDEPPPDPEQP